MNTGLEWGYAFGETVLSPMALALTLTMGVVLLLVPRGRVAIPILIVSFFITEMQRIVIAGLDFTMIRILMLFALLRLVLRHRSLRLEMTALDWALVAYSVLSCLMYTLLLKTASAFVSQLGFLFDTLPMYFFLRVYLVEQDDVTAVLRSLSIIAAGIAAAMVIEYVFGRNLFSVFGGVPEMAVVRDGKMRSQGSFQHPILAGTFGATLFPLFAGLYGYERSRRPAAMLGMVSSLLIAVTCSSSGPLVALLAGIFALCLWRLRDNLRLGMAFLAFLLILYSVAKNAPFYRLITKFGMFGSSSTWHRYELIDNFVRRISEWWLVGTRSTLHWGWMMQDLANQYVSIGVRGGIVTLLAFLSVLVAGFTRLGSSLASPLAPGRDKFLVWTVGCSLFAHVVAFFDVSYSGQMLLNLVTLLCIIGSLSTRLAGRSEHVPQGNPRPQAPSLPPRLHAPARQG
jgi:hypothetical protein